MRLPRVTLSIACVMTVLPLQSLNAEPIGETSRTTVEIMASVAPRIQMTGVAATGGTADQTLCVKSNTADGSYSILALDQFGTAVGVLTTVPGSSSCETGSLVSGSNPLKLAGRAGAPATLLISPQ